MASGADATAQDELQMLRATRSSLTAFHLLLRKLNEDVATMASNYKKLTAANEEWRRVTAVVAASGASLGSNGAAAAASADAGAAAMAMDPPPTPEEVTFVREKLASLLAAHRESMVTVQSLVEELDKARPGFVPKDHITAVLGTMAAANDIMVTGDKIIRI
mmetsp:Transcript_3073/g.7325  ORF Transcript_3073/g.7325 Transcript_3073/m.7325 type:complete len:162 (-) Transcript_3073:29-514(-)